VSQLHAQLLQRAVEKLGGLAEAARYLGVPEVRLRIWMRGLLAPPDDVFLRLVDLLLETPPPRTDFPVHSASSSRRRGKP
jgi:hypothetical protein